ncbi:MAG TPA: MFS transporter [Paenibacillus sp.]|nr:MFS transporter [Paenibacillus sp.]
MGGRGTGLYAIFSSAVAYWLSFSMVRPILTLYFHDLGYGTATIGMLMSAQAILPILLAIPLGGLIDRIGPRRAVLCGSALGTGSGGMLMLGFYQEWLAPVMLSQIVNGIGAMLIWSALQAAASVTARTIDGGAKKNGLLSQFSFVASLAQLAGPAAGGFLSDAGGFSTVFLVFGLLNAAGVAMAFGLPREGKGKRREVSFRFWRTYADGYRLMRDNRPYAAAIGLNAVLFVLVDVRSTFVPLFLADQRFSHASIGAALAAAAAASMVIRPFVGRMLERVGYRAIMLASILSGGAFMLLLSAGLPFWAAAAVMFGWGLCTGVNQPMAMIMVSSSLDDSNQGMGMSIRSMANRTVSGLNPLLFGGVSGLVGLPGAFAGVGVALLLFGVWYRMRPGERDASESSRGAASPSG